MAKLWFNRLFARGRRPSAARRAKPGKFAKSYLRLNVLEDRAVPATVSTVSGVMTITSSPGVNEKIVVGTNGGNVFVFDNGPAQTFLASAVAGVSQINVVRACGDADASKGIVLRLIRA